MDVYVVKADIDSADYLTLHSTREDAMSEVRELLDMVLGDDDPEKYREGDVWADLDGFGSEWYIQLVVLGLDIPVKDA